MTTIRDARHLPPRPSPRAAAGLLFSLFAAVAGGARAAGASPPAQNPRRGTGRHARQLSCGSAIPRWGPAIRARAGEGAGGMGGTPGQRPGAAGAPRRADRRTEGRDHHARLREPADGGRLGRSAAGRAGSREAGRQGSAHPVRGATRAALPLLPRTGPGRRGRVGALVRDLHRGRWQHGVRGRGILAVARPGRRHGSDGHGRPPVPLRTGAWGRAVPVDLRRRSRLSVPGENRAATVRSRAISGRVLRITRASSRGATPTRRCGTPIRSPACATAPRLSTSRFPICRARS